MAQVYFHWSILEVTEMSVRREEEMFGIKPKRGRPPETEQKEQKRIHTAIPWEDWELLLLNLRGRTIGETISHLIRSVLSPLGDDEDAVLESQINDIEQQLLKLRAKKKESENRRKERQYIMHHEEFNSRYPGWALKKVIELYLLGHKSEVKMSAGAISSVFGISFNVEKFNRDIRMEDLTAEDIHTPEEELIKRYSVVRTGIGTRASEFVPDAYKDILAREKMRSYPDQVAENTIKHDDDYSWNGGTA